MADYISSHSGLEIDSAVSAVADKVDKVTGKGLSTNDLTNELLTLLTTNKVKSIATDALNDKLVVTYTDDTVANLNINDIVTDVYVSGATLDATTNVLTLTSTSGGADVTVNLSDFVNSVELTSALDSKVDKHIVGGEVRGADGIGASSISSLNIRDSLGNKKGALEWSGIGDDILIISNKTGQYMVMFDYVGNHSIFGHTTSIGGKNRFVTNDTHNDILGLTKFNSDIELVTEDNGIILKSIGGIRYRLTVDDNGNLETEAL